MAEVRSENGGRVLLAERRGRPRCSVTTHQQAAVARTTTTSARRHGPGQGKYRNAVIATDTSASMKDVAVGKVNQTQDAIDHGVADGQQRIQAADGQSVCPLLQQLGQCECKHGLRHTSSSFLTRALARRGSSIYGHGRAQGPGQEYPGRPPCMSRPACSQHARSQAGRGLVGYRRSHSSATVAYVR